MRTVYLCRHAKSSWDDATLSDFQRPLNERGLRDAPFMAKLFKERGEPVDLLVSSAANRALSTALIFAKGLGIAEDKVLRMDRLYHADPSTITKVLNELPAEVKRVIIFCHNPGITEAVEYLSGEDIGNMPTCGLARIDFRGDDWGMVARDLGTLAWLEYPKRHAENQ